MSKKRPIDPNWYTSAFNELYPVIYAHRTVEAAAPEATFAAAQLKMSHTDHVLDLCCGNGRHMAHMVGNVQAVTGLDYSMDLLTIARRTLPRPARLVNGDMRAIPFGAIFDVVTNFFTSFGYFLTQGDNQSVLTEIARVLKPGGRFFIDYVNGTHVVQTLEPRSVRTEGLYTIVEERWVDDEHERVNKATTVQRCGEVISSQTESVQLYAPENFNAMLFEAGLAAEDYFGDYTGAPLDASQPRMIVVGRKRDAS